MSLEVRTGNRGEAIIGRDTLAAGDSRRGTTTGVRYEGTPEIRSARDKAQSPPISYSNRNFQFAPLACVSYASPALDTTNMTAANLSEISDGKLLRSGILGNRSNI